MRAAAQACVLPDYPERLYVHTPRFNLLWSTNGATDSVILSGVRYAAAAVAAYAAVGARVGAAAGGGTAVSAAAR
ncbi:hypothetical protein STU22726_21710 [Edwardsiella ictaluri]|nr:hypothetical protein STU22726_21710 [Edwardsiella ictaluri]